jgi:hypothetical protein
MKINGTEIINSARTKAYVDANLPGVTVKCSTAALRTALGHSTYVTPAADSAPWYSASRPASGRFYGFFPVKVQGADDSTQSIEDVDLIGDGGVFVSPRYDIREIRVVVVAIAADAEALADGMAWLRDILADDGCRGGFGCTGRSVQMFNAPPTTTGEAASMMRWFYRAEVEDGPKVTKELPSHAGAMSQIEFTLGAGIPWMFTSTTNVTTLAMNSALNYTDPGGEDCSVSTASVSNFINDPFFTAISTPPQPPNILPPNIISITSWRRLTSTIPSALTLRPGRVTPVITVLAGIADTQWIRLRFYQDPAGVSGCDFSGEFFISYLPANSVMHIDGIFKEITVTLADGRVVPGGHLVYGSGGRPFMWPNLSCHDTYTLTADMFPGQTGISVVLDVAVRE